MKIIRFMLLVQCCLAYGLSIGESCCKRFNIENGWVAIGIAAFFAVTSFTLLYDWIKEKNNTP